MAYLQVLSAILEGKGRTGLRQDITIVPTGGLDKVVTFVALLGANRLKLAVLHDYRGAPEQSLMDLMREKMISPRAVLNAAQFRDLMDEENGKQTDIEDLFEPKQYVGYFNKTFERQLNGVVINHSDLPTGPRIVDRLERYLKAKNISVRPSGGFNHYAVASYFASHPPASLDGDTLSRFEKLFQKINGLF